MKNKLILILIAILLYNCTSQPAPIAETEAVFVANPQPIVEQPTPTLSIGAKAPDFKLPATDDKFYSLADFAASKVLVVIFTCNHCPTAQAYEDRMIALTKDYAAKSVQVVAISPNSPLGLLYEELGYSDLGDDFEDMKVRAKNKGYNFPYLYDGDTEKASIQYGPVATPHAFVFDKQRTLQYVGRIDDSEKPGTANAEDLRAAIDALLQDQKPILQETKTFGCSTKWAWKTQYKETVEKEWAAKPVELNLVDSKTIIPILRNENTGKLRLINIWATWCGPCVIEYPDFIGLQRMYGTRNFEFVSLSLDKPEHQDRALKFLKEKHSAVSNYIYSETDKYALIELVDPKWNGALPYTLLIEPNGNIIWRKQGEADFADLKRTIVDHPLIGRYY